MKIIDLSKEEIRQMRGELDVDRYKPKIEPKHTYWDVYRIVQTLENMQTELAEIKRLSAIVDSVCNSR
jgi:hypothetical protein